MQATSIKCGADHYSTKNVCCPGWKLALVPISEPGLRFRNRDKKQYILVGILNLDKRREK